MKSKFNNRWAQWGWAGALAAGVICGGPSLAGVAPVEREMNRAHESYPDDTLSEKQRPTTGDRELATLSADNGLDRGASSVLRCWQNGRLIFEEKDWRPSRAGAGLPGPILKSSEAQFDTLRLSGFGNETFCYLKSKEGSD